MILLVTILDHLLNDTMDSESTNTTPAAANMTSEQQTATTEAQEAEEDIYKYVSSLVTNTT